MNQPPVGPVSLRWFPGTIPSHRRLGRTDDLGSSELHLRSGPVPIMAGKAAIRKPLVEDSNEQESAPTL